ncbi:hypothetical protein H4219_001791 [Mycoemilia scoparia]|uniref:Uncharacterized protein n=1 Tax=Mycoemilia scoparia TaxID=417184 RepID=A0A9W7ZZ85_9FUNG|nr:hypothetical protein H4219_001791 [Mycoemilia scoparia]
MHLSHIHTAFIYLLITFLTISRTTNARIVVVEDGITWPEDPEANGNWESKLRPEYMELLKTMKYYQPYVYDDLTSVLDGSEIPSSYEEDWVTSANQALIDWLETAFSSSQVNTRYLGLPIPSLVTGSESEIDTEEYTVSEKSSEKSEDPKKFNFHFRSGGSQDEDSDSGSKRQISPVGYISAISTILVLGLVAV